MLSFFGFAAIVIQRAAVPATFARLGTGTRIAHTPNDAGNDYCADCHTDYADRYILPIHKPNR